MTELEALTSLPPGALEAAQADAAKLAATEVDVEAESEEVAEAQGPETLEQAEATTETEEVAGEESEEVVEVSPRQAIEYKKAGADEKYELADGSKLTDTDVEFFQQLLAKQGLESKTQQAVERAKQLEGRLSIAEARAQAAAEKARREIGPFAPHVEFLKRNPQAVAHFEKTFGRAMGIQRPTTYDAEKEAMASQNRELKARDWEARTRDFYDGAYQASREKYPDMTDEQVKWVWGAIAASPAALRMITLDNRVPFNQQQERVLDGFDLARNRLISEGKLPDPRLQKAEQEKAKAEEKLRLARERAAVSNPSAGGGAASAKGAGKGRRSMRGFDSADFGAELAARLNK